MKTYTDLEQHYLDINYRYSNNLGVNGKFDSMAVMYDRMYSQLLPENKNAKILDLACGAGQFLYYLKQKGYTDITGVDLCPDMIRYINDYITPNTINADVFRFLETADNYDLIAANDFIEHLSVDDGIKLVGMIHDALAPGGRIILKTGNMAAFGGLTILCNDLTHKTGYTEKSLSTLLRLHEFTALHLGGYYYPKRIMRVYYLLMKLLYKQFYRGNYPKIYSKLIYITGVK